MHRSIRAAIAAGLALVLAAPAARADVISVEALDNATVQPAGPRAGASGKNFFNVEGSSFTTFSSYGVADFNFGVQPATVVGLSGARLLLTQSNAAFSAAGDVVLSLDVASPSADIQPGGTSPLRFTAPDPGTGQDVVDGDLVLHSLGAGPFSYAVVANGHVDAYALSLDPITAAAIMNRLNSASPIRVVVGTGGAGVAATWAGATNSTFSGPILELVVTYEAVPVEPSTWGRLKSVYR